LIDLDTGGHFGAALPLPAGAADDVSAGAELDGDCAGGLSPHAATMAPTAAMVARSATITIFFMIVFSSEGSERFVNRALMPQLCPARQSRDVLMCCRPFDVLSEKEQP
jgi:hypothetical protein